MTRTWLPWVRRLGAGALWGLSLACSSAAEDGSSSMAGAGGSGVPSSSASGGADGANGGAGGAPGNTPLAELLTREQYEALFPNRNELYGYEALIEAAASYPDFAGQGSPEERRRELAAFLGNIAHETTGGWAAAPGGPEAWGLYFIEEVGCEDGACTQYCDAASVRYPCAPGKTYHGRGPIQLSWNFNYGQFGEVLGFDLLQDPDRVTSDGAVAFCTALWFWMTPQPPKPSAHAALLGTWQPSPSDAAAGRAPGFGMTVNIINGGLECGIPTDDRVRDRIRFFRHFASVLGTTVGDGLECAGMQPY